ncbi:MAG: hypothetical protein BAJALOKI2v1_130035 [Promethearchaeota archaeon]|nr:MAG: hypothetical protein BAJALOKI2v1_130035 [Candidatus Lokiarchaeota archaeon]
MSKKEKKSETNRRAEEIAKVFVENMLANMTDPEFLIKKERRMQEAANKVLKKSKERKQKDS